MKPAKVGKGRGNGEHRSVRLLLREAQKARRRARAGYSGFKVGAALESFEGDIHTGCNIENASYGLTVCAERVALLKALSEGVKRFRRLAVVTGAREITPPCGACRQLLWEYCGNIPLHLSNLKGKTRMHWLSDLLPHPFDRHSLATRPATRATGTTAERRNEKRLSRTAAL